MSTEHVSPNANLTPQANKFVSASMKDIGEVILSIPFEEKIKHSQEFRNLQEEFLHKHVIGGNFEFSEHNYGSRVIEQIIKYKPKTIKPEYDFVVEM